MKTLPKILLAMVSCSVVGVSCYALPGDGRPPAVSRLKAAPALTYQVSLRLCNYSDNPVDYAFAAQGNFAILQHSNFTVKAGDCQLASFRPNNDNPWPGNVKITASQGTDVATTFEIGGLTLQRYWNSNYSISKQLTVSNLNASPELPIYIHYSANNGQWPTTKLNNQSYQNSSGGVVPDYTLCTYNPDGDPNNTACDDSSL